MATRRLRILLSRVADIKRDEEAVAVLFFVYFFLITAPYYIIKSLRNASFLDRLTDARLPLAYFLTAVLMGIIVNAQARLQVRLARRSLIIGSLGFFLATLCLFWWLLRFPWPWIPVAFWLWANTFAVVLVTQFWILVNDRFNPREAKRLIGFIGSGAQLGAILGGVMAGTLARSGREGWLLPLAAGLMVLGMGAAARIFDRQGRPASGNEPEWLASRPRPEKTSARRVGFRDALRTTRASTYLKLLAGIMIVTWVVSTLIDYQFNSIVSRRIEGGANLTAFFGFFNAGTMGFAFLFQLLLTSRIIKTWGIRVTLLIYPLALLVFSGGMGIVAYASIIPAILLKTSDKSLAYSLNQSVRELLYIPISPERKYKSKIFIDMFLNRFAKGLAAVILMAMLLVFPGAAAIRYISLAVVAGIAVWLGLNVRIGREYGGLVKDKLEREQERGERLVAQTVDVDTAKLVFDALESSQRSPALYWMDLYDLVKRGKLTPEVKRLLTSQPDELRASLGTLFDEGETGLGLATEEWDEDALKKDVGDIMDLDVYQEVMKGYIDQALRRPGPEGEIDRMEAARAIGFMGPQAPAAARLEDLINDASSEVSRQAIRSAAELQRRADVPALVGKLPEPALRQDVIEALEKYGPRLAGTLADYLHDPTMSLDIRQAAAKVLAGIGTQEAADFLVGELGPDDDPLDGEIIDGLDMIRSDHPEVLFPRQTVKERVLAKVRVRCRRLAEAADANRTKAEVWADSLRSVFQLLGLIYAHEDISRAYQNLLSGTEESVAYAIELLDTMLDRDLRDAIVPIVEDLSIDGLRRCGGLAGAPRRSRNSK